MKKLVVTKILILATIPLWVACGKRTSQAEVSPVQNNQIKFLTRKSDEGVKGLVQIANTTDQTVAADQPIAAAQPVTADPSVDEGVKGIVADQPIIIDQTVDEGVKGITDLQASLGALDEGVKGIIGSQLDEGVKGSMVDLNSNIQGLVGDLQEFEEGVKGLSDDSLNAEAAALDEGVKGIINNFLELEEGVKGLTDVDEGVKGKIADLGNLVSDYSQKIESLQEGVKGKSVALEEGVKGIISLEGNVLTIQGAATDTTINQIILVINGMEKYAIDVDLKTRAYNAQFELSDDDMKKMITDLVIGKEVITVMILDGQLQQPDQF